MATMQIPQNSFISGVVNEDRIRGRYDAKQYDSWAKTLHNVNINPQGGAYRRGGTRFMLDYTAKGTYFRFINFWYSDTIKYILIFYNDKIDVFKDHVLVHTITGTGITATQVRELYYAHKVNRLILTHSDFAPKVLSRGASDVIWSLVDMALDPAPLFGFSLTTTNPSGTITPSATSGNIKLTASVANFTAADIGGYITGNGGEARIVEYVSTTVVNARVTIGFVDLAAITTGNWSIERGYEPAWSVARGFPRTCCFHNDALLMGGTKSLPDIVWKSETGYYYGFDDTRALADSSLSFAVPSDGVNDIVGLVSGNDLIILTSRAEFYVSGNITPDLAFEVRKQEEIGARKNIRPLFVDGAPQYIDARSDVLRELTYSDVDAKYSSTNLSIFIPGIIKDPVDIAHQKPIGSRDNDYILILNGAGDWVVFNTLRKQNVAAFTTASSREDKLLAACDFDGSLYAMFLRTINGVDKYYLERFDEAIKMDCCKVYTGSSISSLTGLNHLIGETITVVADGKVIGDFLVPGSGTVTLSAPYTEIQVGFKFFPKITTLPPSTQLPNGVSVGQIRRIVAVTLGMSETGEVFVNGRRIRTRTFGSPLFGSPAPLYSGRKRVTLLGGYSRDPVVTIEQFEPLGFHITDLIKEVQV